VAQLTADERRALPAEQFAVPDKRALPIHDLNHARLAQAWVGHAHGLTARDRAIARHRIAAALARFGEKEAAE
jgi:hypothetical protein